MVTFQTPDGTPGFHQSDQIEDAVTFVERLRNEQGIKNTRIYRMEELSFDFRPYYRVELTTAETRAADSPATPTPPPREPADGSSSSIDLTEAEEEAGTKAEDASELPPPPPTAAPSASSPRRGLFSRPS